MRQSSKGNRSFLWLVLSLAFMLVVAACGDGESTDTTTAPTATEAPSDDTTDDGGTDDTAAATTTTAPAEPRELVFATSVSTPSLDPYQEISDARMRRSPLMYDGLVDWTSDFGVAPGLAESWEYDGNTLRFHLREGVVFHDGTPLTSADVVYSLEKVLESPGSGFYSQIVAVNAVDDLTVELEVSAPSDALIAALGGRYAYIVPEGAVENYDLAVTAVGTGPFKVDEFAQGEYLRLVKNEDYWRADEVGVDILTIVIVPDEASIAAGLRTGEIDVAIFEDARIADLVEGESGLTVFEEVAARWDILDFPAFDVAPWNNTKFRQAIVAAIDPEAVMGLAIDGRGTLLGGHPPALWASLPYEDAPYAAQDTALAQQLLDESGVDTSAPLTLVSIQGYGALNSAAEVIADQLGDIGLTVEIEVQELGNWIDTFLAREFDTFTMNSWGGWIDPDQLYFNHLHQQPDGRDFRKWENAEVSQLLDDARGTVDRAEREALYLEIQSITSEEVPWFPLYSANFVGAYRDNVSNWGVHPSGFYHDLRWVQVDG
jgi:peptide/nickel transport system substrate-binding protein